MLSTSRLFPVLIPAQYSSRPPRLYARKAHEGRRPLAAPHVALVPSLAVLAPSFTGTELLLRASVEQRAHDLPLHLDLDALVNVQTGQMETGIFNVVGGGWM